MRTINFTQKEVVIYRKLGTNENVNALVSSVDLLSNIIDNGKVIIARVSVAGRLRVLYLCDVNNYKPLNEWTTQEIDNKIIQLL